MTKNLKTSGDNVAPPLSQSKNTLQASAELAEQPTAGLDAANKAVGKNPLGNLGNAIAGNAAHQPPLVSCTQLLWFSFFFDGTGNNINADLGTLEHSNVARLYRAHPVPDPVKGLYSIYVPGIGTYFKEVGDKGGTMLGNGLGAEGQSRMDWALKQFDKNIAPHLARASNPANKIIEINITAFGFSRGATQARAFIRDFIAKRCSVAGAGLQLKQGNWPLRVRFMGLFDTVASVGLPMSVNNQGYLYGNREHSEAPFVNGNSRAIDIAFGAPGADPAPGNADGHGDWADGLQIHPMVEQAVHLVAAHEVRNSFPVDSVCDGGRKPANCKEIVYPGVHSNVGGGYRPGEEGKSTSRSAQLSLIPLRRIYDLALEYQVPFLPESAWQDFNQDDFETSTDLKSLYNHYMSTVGWGNRGIGNTMNAHMAVYYAWRFAQIRRKQKGDQSLAGRINKNEVQYKAERDQSEKEMRTLEQAERTARADIERAEKQRSSYILNRGYQNTTPEGRKPYDDKVVAAKATHAKAQDDYLSVKAKRDTMPGEGDKLIKNLAKYDAQLLSDAKAIYDACVITPSKRSQLRPHYRGLIEAYENEFVRNKGLIDEKIFTFFENHVHDSLAGFAKDDTLPSDPRVVYMGNDLKSRHAMIEKEPESESALG
jgi:hypothetical protein